MTRIRPFLIVLASCSVLALSGCESDDEKAEGFYQAGLALLEDGDKERAIIELRNVFNHDGFHKEARILYADTVRGLGRLQEAYGQYLRLIEQYPDTIDARVALAELALAQNNWPEVERHGAAALELAPDQPEVKALDLVIQYRQAAVNRDTSARAELTKAAEDLLAEIRTTDGGESDALVRIIIDNYVQSEQFEKALVALDAALDRAPATEDLNMLKVRLLFETENAAGTGEHLRKMIDLFPENHQFKQLMVRWFVTQQDLAGAEAFLRDQAGNDTDPVEGHLQVIQMLSRTQGPDAAHAELTRLLTANTGTENGYTYAGMLASMDFQAGKQDKAIADITAAIEASDQGSQKVLMQVALASMLESTGKQDAAKAVIDNVLENDSSNVPALQKRAEWLIAEDKPGAAIVALRSALDQNPRNATTLTLMAQAHERDGDTELVGERLALAMEASGNAVPETLRYANFLRAQNRQQVAVTVLEDARRRQPANVPLRIALANLHITENDWPKASALVTELNALDTDQSRRAATELEARILQSQNRTEESMALLQQQLDNAPDADAGKQLRTIGLIVQTQIRAGKVTAARKTLNPVLVENPDNPSLKVVNAVLYTAEGDLDQAEAIYRDLIAQFPQSEVPVRMLISLLSSTGRGDEARAILETALKAKPDQPSLLLIKASYLEQERDFDGAIEVYETLYDVDSSSPVVANNLASLMTTHRDDSESLARAANIVRRLRGTDVPAFQDTYGWIAYRRENFEEALSYLEPAAKGLANDALVQYHLGMTYVALGRTADARAQLGKALEIAADSPLPQFDAARAALAGLE